MENGHTLEHYVLQCNKTQCLRKIITSERNYIQPVIRELVLNFKNMKNIIVENIPPR